MLRDVQALQLLLLGDAKPDCVLDDQENDGNHHRRPEGRTDCAQTLDQEEMGAVAVKQTLAGGEEAGEDGPRCAADAVDGNRAHRVVDLQNGVKEIHGDRQQQSGDGADGGGSRRGDHVAAGGDCHQPRQGGVKGHAHIRLLVANPSVDHSHDTGHRRGHVGGDKNQPRADDHIIPLHAHGGAAVETKPAEPEDKHTQSAQGQTVAQDGPGPALVVVFADPGTQDSCADAGAHAAHHVNRRGTRKVMESQSAQPAAAPDPVAGNGIDEGGDAERVEAVGNEPGPLRHSPGDDGGRRGAEDRLENEVGKQGHPGGQDGVIVPSDEGVQPSDDGPGPGKHQSKAQKPVSRCANAEVHEVLHQDIAGVLGSGKACLAHGEARLHQEDQSRSQQNPDGADR